MRRWGIATGLVLVLAAAGLGAAWWLGAFRSRPQNVPMAIYLSDDATPTLKATIDVTGYDSAPCPDPRYVSTNYG